MDSSKSPHTGRLACSGTNLTKAPCPPMQPVPPVSDQPILVPPYPYTSHDLQKQQDALV